MNNRYYIFREENESVKNNVSAALNKLIAAQLKLPNRGWSANYFTQMNVAELTMSRRGS